MIAYSKHATAAAEKFYLILQILHHAEGSVVPDLDVGCDFVCLVQRIKLTLDVPKVLQIGYMSNPSEFSLHSDSRMVIGCRCQRIEGSSTLRVCCDEK